MIYGIGVDICDIKRMRKALEHSGFKERVFAPEEIEYAETAGGNSAMHYAASFAAKEALAKATGLGISKMGLDASFVTRTESGPRFIFSETFALKLEELGVTSSFLSISHEGDIAVAVVVLEGKECKDSINPKI